MGVYHRMTLPHQVYLLGLSLAKLTGHKVLGLRVSFTSSLFRDRFLWQIVLGGIYSRHHLTDEHQAFLVPLGWGVLGEIGPEFERVV